MYVTVRVFEEQHSLGSYGYKVSYIQVFWLALHIHLRLVGYQVLGGNPHEKFACNKAHPLEPSSHLFA